MLTSLHLHQQNKDGQSYFSGCPTPNIPSHIPNAKKPIWIDWIELVSSGLTLFCLDTHVKWPTG